MASSFTAIVNKNVSRGSAVVMTHNALKILSYYILLLTNNVIWDLDTYITIPMTLFADNDIGKEIKIHLMKFLCITTTAGGTHTQKWKVC